MKHRWYANKVTKSIARRGGGCVYKCGERWRAVVPFQVPHEERHKRFFDRRFQAKRWVELMAEKEETRKREEARK